MGGTRTEKAGRAASMALLSMTFALVVAAPAESAPLTVTGTDGVPLTAKVFDQTFGGCDTTPWYVQMSTIHWGDGTGPDKTGIPTSPNWTAGGAIGSAGRVTITGTHTYATPGTYHGTVSLTIQCLEAQNPMMSGTFTANVADNPPSGSPATINLLSGQPFSGTVATFTDTNATAGASTYAATIDWGDGTPPGTGTITGSATNGFTVAASHTYTAPGSYQVKVTIKDASGVSGVVSDTATVSSAPAGVAFTISPDTDPTLSHKTLTFAIADPTPGVTYEWDFGDTDSPTGSATAPFVVEATGATVTHAYDDPPIPADQAPSTTSFPGGGSSTRFAVYVVRVTALVPGHPDLTATPQNVVVVPTQPPTAEFQVLRESAANGGTGQETAVTAPVTIVPQATLPTTGAAAPDQIVREDFWFNLQGATPATAPAGAGSPDLTCLSDGVCGHYSGTTLVPLDSALTPVAGEQDLGTGALNLDGTPSTFAGCRTIARARDRARGRSVRRRPRARPAIAACAPPPTASPTAGFESFSINFWTNALGNIGSPGGITTLPQEDTTGSPFTPGYPPLSTVRLGDADGLHGSQGIPFEACFGGYPLNASPYSIDDENCDSTAYSGLALIDGGNNAVAFGPYDVAHFGVNSTQQLEDQFNFLYNYATVVGVDTNLDSQFGPATGASEGPGNTTIPRTITMVAYDSEGLPSAPVTENVPLTPATNPDVQLCLRDVTLNTACVTATGKKKTPFTITAGDQLQFDTSGSSGGTDPILYYAVEVGQPNKTQSWCGVGKLGGYTWDLTPANQGGGGPPMKPTGPGAGRPFAADTGGAHAAAAPPSGPGDTTATKISTNKMPLERTPWPMPGFSDLLAGAFPYHDCGSYAIRTVDANASPQPLPKSGPNVIVHPAIARSHDASGPGGGVSTIPVKTLPAPTTADPVLITQNPDGLNFTFPKSGMYSVAVAAYNSSGLGAITRIDGFQAEPGRNAGQCEHVDSQPIGIRDTNLKGSPVKPLAFSGDCVTVVTKGHTPVLYASSTTIDIAGAPVTPAPGESLVIDPANGHVYVTDCTIKTLSITGKFVNPCPDPSGGKAGSLYLALGIGLNQKPPGIAYVKHFNGTQADKILGPLQKGPLATLGKKLKQSAKPVKGCGLYPGAQQWAMSSGAQYDGFAVATKPCVTFTTTGQSRIAFWDSLPSGFGDAAKHQPSPTDEVVLEGQDVPAVSSLQTTQYANVARAKHPQTIIAGSPASFQQVRLPAVRARAASANLPGFPSLPSCPQKSIGKSGIAIPNGTDLGPISIPVGANFCLNPKTGDFIGNVNVNIPGPIPINGVDVGFEIGHGRLIDAGGEVSGNIPIFPAVFINDFKFDVKTDPTEVAAEITASIADVLDVEGGLLVKPQTPEVDFEGTVSIFGFQFGDFAIDFVKHTVGFHVTIGKDFGPASINITVQGAMAWSPSFAFYMEGKGSACLFICIGVDGLVSNEGLAACGSINLLFVTLSAGFAVIWSGPQAGVHLFTGCDLTPYIPAELRNVKGAAPDVAARAAAGSGTQATLLPGGSEQLVLYRKHDCLPGENPAATHCRKTVAAVQVHSLLSSEATGETPIVTLTSPDGRRVIQTPATPGYYGFDSSAKPSGGMAAGQTMEGTSLVDQNPVPLADSNTMSSAYCAGATETSIPAGCARVTTTTLFVADPGRGLWTLSVGTNSPPVVDTQVAFSQPPPKPKQFHAAVHSATLSEVGSGWQVGIAGHTYSSSLLASHNLVLSQTVETPPKTRSILDDLHDTALAENLYVPQIDVRRTRAILLKVPPGFQGKVTVIDHGPTVDQVIASNIASAKIPRGGLPIVFQPSPDFGGMHHIEAFLMNSAGMPDRTIMLNSFRSPPVPKPKAPRIVKIVRTGSTVDVYFRPGNAPVADGVGLALSTAGGQRLEATFSGGELHAIGPLTGIGGAKQASEYMISVPNVDPTEDINVGIAGYNEGVLSRTSAHFMRPVIPSVGEGHLLAARSGAKVLS